MENRANDRVEMLVCLDALSPYSFFGLFVLLRYQERWNLHLKLLPVLLGAVQKATGNKPPGSLPAKAKWGAEDLARNARFMNVPFRGLPAGFGISLSSIRPQRVLTAIAESKLRMQARGCTAVVRAFAPDFACTYAANFCNSLCGPCLLEERWQKPAISICVQKATVLGYYSKELAAAFMAFFHAIFAVKPNNEVDLANSNFLRKCCMSAGFSEAEAEQYVLSSEDDTIKSRLKENTELTVEKGIFGAPTIYVAAPVKKSGQQPHEMMFFGSDRFEQMAFAIGKVWEGPNPQPTSKL